MPPSYAPERAYVVDIVLARFLGLDYRLSTAECAATQLQLPNGNRLIVDDCLFATPVMSWLSDSTLPRQPLASWRVPDRLRPLGRIESVPVLFGTGELHMEGEEGSLKARLGVDVFGSVFFMLSRYEERVVKTRDRFSRFPALESLAMREGFLDRPVVNEYVELLWRALSLLCPGLVRSRRTYRLVLTHDVDVPSSAAGLRPHELLRGLAGDLMRRRSPAIALGRARTVFSSQFGVNGVDPYSTFEFIMNASEHVGLLSAFYFICGRSAGALDGSYSIRETWVQRIMKTIHERGHEIGLHASFNTFDQPALLRQERQELAQVAANIGVAQPVWGGRQHYLRWECPTTWQAWEDADLAYDSTLGFADHVGFRTGCCFEYPVFNLDSRKPCKLVERPLVVMEGTLLGKSYMNVSEREALEWVEKLSQQCRAYQGDFVLLWHNHYLVTRRQQAMYLEAVRCAV